MLNKNFYLILIISAVFGISFWIGFNVNLLPVEASINAPIYDELFRILFIIGLIIFGFLFAINSSLHSFLILAYTDEDDDVAINVGLYYAANALGRFVGTLFSGLAYLWGGLTLALFFSAGFLFVNWVLSLSFPSTSLLKHETN